MHGRSTLPQAEPMVHVAEEQQPPLFLLITTRRAEGQIRLAIAQRQGRRRVVRLMPGASVPGKPPLPARPGHPVRE